MRALEDVVRGVSKVLSELDIDYVIVGGVAVSGWGNVRTTRDVDIIMDFQEKDIQGLIDALAGEGFEVSFRDIKDAIKEKSHFTIFDKMSDYHIDAKGAYGEREQRSLRTRKAANLWEARIFIASPEDTIANKLVFGSEQDIRDAEGVYVRQMGKLDLSYLEHICKEMDVAADLERLKKKVARYLDEDSGI